MLQQTPITQIQTLPYWSTPDVVSCNMQVYVEAEVILLYMMVRTGYNYN
jgi:hypothetical protein